MKNHGLIYAISAYVLWGFAPLLWKQLEAVGSIEIVAHRTLWSFVLVLALILISRQWRPMVNVLEDRQTVLRLLMSSLLVSLNWLVFIWAVNAGYLVESSMGYFINPLISILFGVFFFQGKAAPKPMVSNIGNGLRHCLFNRCSWHDSIYCIGAGV